MTANLTTIATAAVQFLGVLDPGEGLSAQQLTDAQNAANNLSDNWSSDALMALSVTRSTQSLTALGQSYTIGPSQTWNMTRPAGISGAALLNTAGSGSPIEVVSAVKWTKLPDRQSQSYTIKYLFYDRGNPTGTVYVSPIPIGFGLSVELITWSALAQFADTTTAITILPGYLRMFELALAIELAPQYGMMPSEIVLSNFKDAFARVRNLNAELLGIEAPSKQDGSDGGASIAPNPGAE